MIESKRNGGYSRVAKSDTKGFLLQVQKLQREDKPIHMTSLTATYHVGKRRISELPDLRDVEITDEYVEQYRSDYTRSINAGKRKPRKADGIEQILRDMGNSVRLLEKQFRELAERYGMK